MVLKCEEHDIQQQHIVSEIRFTSVFKTSGMNVKSCLNHQQIVINCESEKLIELIETEKE